MPNHFQPVTHEGIHSLTPYKPGKSIEELAQERGIKDIIKLASNENPLGCSPLALEALRALPSHVIATYPSPIIHPLMPRLAAELGINTNQLFLSNGSDYIFSMLLNCFALHTDKHILTHDYAFSTYAIQAKTVNIPVLSVSIDHDWQVNIDTIIQACTDRTSLIFIANPNNPTGLVISQKELKRLLEHIPQQTFLVLDEAYYEFAADTYTCSSIEWLHEHPNLIITRTFSKLYGLAGLRLGYAIANPAVITLLQRVQLPFAVNQIALNAGLAALDDKEFVSKSLDLNKRGKKQIRDGLDKLGITYLPSECNFLTFDCTEDGLSLYNFLLDRGIIVRPLHPYQMDNYIRVSIGTEEQNNRFLDALGKYFNA